MPGPFILKVILYYTYGLIGRRAYRAGWRARSDFVSYMFALRVGGRRPTQTLRHWSSLPNDSRTATNTFWWSVIWFLFVSWIVIIEPKDLTRIAVFWIPTFAASKSFDWDFLSSNSNLFSIMDFNPAIGFFASRIHHKLDGSPSWV